MSGTKTALKAINASIQAKKYEEAAQQARDLISSDPKSYQANIFLGFALSRQTKYAEAEDAYNAATKIKEGEPQAWQGLIQVYEKQASAKVGQYQIAALRLAQIFEAQDDKYRCGDVINKFVDFAKDQGTRLQHREALELILPTSPIYDYLEGRVPHPSHTYQIIAQITEFEEKERINKEIGERRTRLGAKIGQVTTEVKREVLDKSNLEDIYNKIIDWSNDDEIRRQYEEKLIQRCFDTLIVLPTGQAKTEMRTKLNKLATDMVIIKHPFKMAWDISIEWSDPEHVQSLDANMLREYISFFPDSGLAQVLRGFMTCEISPFPPPSSSVPQLAEDESEDDDDDGGGALLESPLPAEDRLLLMTEGMSNSSTSILAHRLMGEYYQFLDEHEPVVELTRNAKRLVAAESSKTGLSFKNADKSFTALLGTALVFYQSPKNHPEAKGLFEELLRDNPSSTPALIGIGMVYEEEEDFPAAIDFLERALERDSSNVRVRAEAAWVKALNGDYLHGRNELEACLPSIEAKDLKSRDLLAQTQYRIGVCIWNLDSSAKARKDRTGAYAYFLAALKSNLNYAPAYTSLGTFYADYLKDKKRSRKCFQKAFELSPSEVEAAERLARIFADQGEWELVEVVAQRVVNSGKVKPAPGSKRKGISWPFAALGVAELNKQDFAKSIVSFQSALRITPSDYHSWVGLGESYLSSGRYIAATKAFQHAEQFENELEKNQDGETWFAKHMLANVKRELGEYDEAIEGYRAVLADRPEEFGVSIALVQTLVDSAWDSIEKGLFGQASQRAAETIGAAVHLSRSRTDAFNLWRAVGDACAVFSWVRSRASDFPISDVNQLLQTEAPGAYDLFADVDGVSGDIVSAKGLYPKDEQDGLSLTQCLHAAIMSHKRAIYASSHDKHAQAVAHYNLGWIEHRAHVCLCFALKKKSTRYLKAAVRCFKRAIELEAGNSEFWNALGIVTSELNPKVAQHSFVRSLFLNERSAPAWTNLGTLYLMHNDYELANNAFTRAQSTDPEFSHAWVGQGLIALMMGDSKEANLLFAHAIEISDSSSLITKRQYSQSLFDHLISSTTGASIADLVQPLFELNQLQSMTPNELTSKHLSTLLLERVNNVPDALKTLSSICETVEADYEVTESPSSLSRFALAKADVARSHLANQEYDAAVESGDLALQLSEEDSGNELSPEARQKCRLSAHLTLGLANYYLNNMQAALEYFETALSESNGNPDAVCLLAQVLWATGDDASRAKARDQLFDSVEKNPEHVQSVLLLGVIALLDSDDESIEAVTAELQSLRTSKKVTDLQQSHVGEILRAVAAFSGDDSEQEVLNEVQTEVQLHPSSTHGWGRLAKITGDTHAAEMALTTAQKAVPPYGELDASDLAVAHAGTGTIADAQRGIMAAPWRREGWEALSEGLVGKE